MVGVLSVVAVVNVVGVVTAVGVVAIVVVAVGFKRNAFPAQARLKLKLIALSYRIL